MFSKLLYLAVLTLAVSSGCGNAAPPGPPPGSISLAWSIADADGHTVVCDAVGASTVSLTARNRTSGASVTTAWPCAGSPRAQLLAAGVYDARIALDATNGTPIATAPDQPGIVVVAGQLTPLAPAAFVVRASLVLSFAAPPLPANCGSLQDGGTGISSSTLILQDDANGPCEPVTVFRARGQTPVGTYKVNCGSPQVANCFEADETFTVPSLRPGAYTVHGRGKINGTNCWGADATILVALGVPTVRTVNLVALSSPGCPHVPFAPVAPNDAGGVP
jgi:hypothetical protein